MELPGEDSIELIQFPLGQAAQKLVCQCLVNICIECSLSKLINDTKLCDTVDTVEGRDAIERDLERLERWVCANLMKFNKVKWKVLHMDQGNPKHKYRLGNECIENSPAEKGLGSISGWKSDYESAMCTHSPKSQLYPGLHPEKCDQQVEGGNSPPLLHSGESPPGVLCPALGPQRKKDVDLLEGAYRIDGEGLFIRE